ncbi:MAG: zinc metallopeptidase, partial [Clostridia bacterium]|nr:zinc metallopeptidase [Clostridia bacterium]
DPQNGVLRLSSEVYGSRSIAALGVAAHEAGHAIQDAQDYAPMRIRANLVPIANIGSGMAMPLFMLGLILSWEPLTKIGILFFAFSVAFYLVTLPVEFNASGRAVAVLSGGYLAADEVKGVKAVLSAAALTYVASALQAVLQLLRLVLIAGSRNRDD